MTRFVLGHRWVVLGVWVIAFGVCGLASTQLADLLTNRFALPGTDTHRAELILEEHSVSAQRARSRSSSRVTEPRPHS